MPAFLFTKCASAGLAHSGILAILGVIAAPITTGDTAMRSLRLIIADSVGIEQRKVVKRLLVTIPIVLMSYVLININFDILWRYFAWCNQTLSIFTLWACTVYLARYKKSLLYHFDSGHVHDNAVCLIHHLCSPRLLC